MQSYYARSPYPLHKRLRMFASFMVRESAAAFRASTNFQLPCGSNFARQQQAFSNVAAWSTERFDLGHGGEARYADGMWVSGDFFQTLGLQPVLGRLFSSADDRKNCGNEGAVISYSFWQSEFAGRSNVIGRSVSVNRQPFPIIGVTPLSFSGLEVGRKFDVALPLCAEPLLHTDGPWTNSATTWWLAIIGRLKPGWTLQTASAQFASIAPAAFAATAAPGIRRNRKEELFAFRFPSRTRRNRRFAAAQGLPVPAVSASGNIGVCPAHWLRQYREPHARESQRAATRDGVAAQSRGLPEPACSSTANRKSPSRRGSAPPPAYRLPAF